MTALVFFFVSFSILAATRPPQQVFKDCYRDQCLPPNECKKRKRCLSLSLSVEDSQSIAGVVWLRDLNAAVMELCSVAPRCHISGARSQAGRHGGGGRLVGSRSSLLDTYRRLGSRAGLSHTETRSALTRASRTGSLASVFVRGQRWQQPL